MPSADADFINQLPKDYESLVHMGNQIYDQGNFTMAAEIYRRALEIDGSSPDVRTDYGACLNAMGLPQRAVDQFTIVVREHPTHRISHFNLGIVYRNMNRTDSAKYFWEKFLELEPTGEMADAARRYIAQMEG
jgi:Tfp pilus assembly protein PilF